MKEKGVVHFDWHNEPQDVWIDGRHFNFKSKAEYKWAVYLQFLKDTGAIDNWDYETTKFEFGERWRKRRIYTPDFEIKEDGQTVWHEVKTALQQKDITRFRCMQNDFPDEKVVLILPHKTTKSIKQRLLRQNASRYVERIVYSEPIYRKFGKL